MLLFALGCGTRTPPQLPKPTPTSTANAKINTNVPHVGESAPENAAEPADINADQNLHDRDQSPSAEAEPPQPERLAVLLPGGPLLLDVHLTVEGLPHEKGLERLLDLVLAAADTDEDSIPTWDELTANTQFLHGPLVRDAAAAQRDAGQWKQTYDMDRNGFLSTSEAKAWLGRDTGGTARSLRLQSSRELYYQPRRHSRVWGLLDADDDGVLAADEIAAASRRLLTRDANDDRLLYLHELESLRDQLRAADANMAMARQRSADRQAAMLLSGDEDWQLVSAVVTDLYAAGRSLTIDAFRTRTELFAALDADGSGRLATSELAAMADRPADLLIEVEFGEPASAADTTCRIGLGDSPPPLVEVLAATGTRLALRVAEQHVVLSVHDLAPADDFDKAADERLASLDKDGSGYLDPAELEEGGAAAAERFAALDSDADGMVVAQEIAGYLRLENAVARSQVQIVVHDQGDALFERLDADHDGRLGEREIAEASRELQSLDGNHDGRLTAGEIAGQTTVLFVRGQQNQSPDLSQLTALASPVSADGRAGPKWFVRGDSNGDGEISRREFLGTPEQFRQLDVNGDGWISAREAESQYRLPALRPRATGPPRPQAAAGPHSGVLRTLPSG